MKVRYEFVNQVVEIDVDEAWGELLIDMDRQERNNNQTERRRHVSADMLAEKHGFLLADKHDCALETIIADESLAEFLRVLTPQQRTLLRRVYLEGVPMAEIACNEGMLKQAISERVRRAKSKIIVNRR